MKRNKFATWLNSTVSHTETANTPVLMITVTTIFSPEVIRAILAPEPETQPVTQLATLMTDVFSVSMKGSLKRIKFVDFYFLFFCRRIIGKWRISKIN